MKRERRRRKSPPGNAAGNKDVSRTLRTAVDLHQSGRLREAEAAYRNVLVGNPNNPDALHLLGLIAHQAGRLDEAVGHNVRIGRGCLIVAQVGISGSTQLGDFVVLAGQVGIAGHLKIGNGAIVAAMSGLSRNVPDGETFAGIPARPVREWRRIIGALARMGKRGGGGKS